MQQLTQQHFDDSITKLLSHTDKELKKIKDEIAKLATKDEIAKLATKEEVAKLATKDEIAKLATKEEVAKLATKDEIAKLATKDEIAKLATKEEVAKLATKAEMLQLIKESENKVIADLTKKINNSQEELARMTNDGFNDLLEKINNLDLKRRVEKLEKDFAQIKLALSLS